MSNWKHSRIDLSVEMASDLLKAEEILMEDSNATNYPKAYGYLFKAMNDFVKKLIDVEEKQEEKYINIVENVKRYDKCLNCSNQVEVGSMYCTNCLSD